MSPTCTTKARSAWFTSLMSVGILASSAAVYGRSPTMPISNFRPLSCLCEVAQAEARSIRQRESVSLLMVFLVGIVPSGLWKSALDLRAADERGGPGGSFPRRPGDRLRLQPGRAGVRHDHPRHRDHPLRAGRAADAGLHGRPVGALAPAEDACGAGARLRDDRLGAAGRGDGVPGVPPPAAAPRAAHERDHRHGRHVDPVHQRRAHHLGLRAAALPGAVFELGVRFLRRARFAATRVEHGLRRGADGADAAVPQVHAHWPGHAGGGAGPRGGATDGRQPEPDDGLHLRHRRHDGGRRRRDVRIALLLVFRDGFRCGHPGLCGGHARRAGEPGGRHARGDSLRPHRDLQRLERCVCVQGRHRHGAPHRDPAVAALGPGRSVETPLVSAAAPALAAPLSRAHKVATTLILAALVALPLSGPHQFILHMLSLVAISSIVALGLQLLLGFSGQLSIGQAAFYGIGAYASGLFATKLGMPFPAAFVLAGLVAALTSLLMVPITRLTGAYLAVATLGFSILVYLLIKNEEWLTGGSFGLMGIPRPSLFGFVLTKPGHAYLLCVAVAAIVYFALLRLEHSRFGRAINAIRQNEDAARASGLPVTLLKSQCFVIAAFVAGLGGGVFLAAVVALRRPHL